MEKNEETINAYSSSDGFTEALDRPPPESAIACDYRKESGDFKDKNNNTKAEDIALK
jgi:hypothetical protein